MEFLNNAEVDILINLHEALKCAFLDYVMPVLSFLANAGWFWIALAVVLLFFKKTRRIGVTMAIALFMGLVICNFIIKPVVARIRPYDWDETRYLYNVIDSLWLKKIESDFSFPSGHTIASFEGAVSIFIYNKKWGIAAIVLAVLIAFSRIYLCYHYPLDVLVSLILGIGFAIIASLIAKWLIKKTKMPCE